MKRKEEKFEKKDRPACVSVLAAGSFLIFIFIGLAGFVCGGAAMAGWKRGFLSASDGRRTAMQAGPVRKENAGDGRTTGGGSSSLKVLISRRFSPASSRTGRREEGIFSGTDSGFPRILEPLEGEDPKQARRLAAGCVVRLDVLGEEGEYYGSGVIWDAEDESLILATAGHLLKKGEIVRIAFPDGERDGEYSVAISAAADVGFVRVPWQTASACPPDTARIPAVACLHQRIFDSLDADSPLSVIACSPEGVGDLFCQGGLAERAWYREEFGTDVMLMDCRSREGMSGAGVFDGYGCLVGIVVGGSEVDTAVLSMEKINAAYEEIFNRRRDTQPYCR